jgi:hypothetical protein
VRLFFWKRRYTMTFAAEDGRTVEVRPDPGQSVRSALFQGTAMASKKLSD